MTNQQIQEKAEKWVEEFGGQRVIWQGYIAGYNESVKDNYSESDVLAIIEKVVYNEYINNQNGDVSTKAETYLKHKHEK